jgi:hypothetical protein
MMGSNTSAVNLCSTLTSRPLSISPTAINTRRNRQTRVTTLCEQLNLPQNLVTIALRDKAYIAIALYHFGALWRPKGLLLSKSVQFFWHCSKVCDPHYIKTFPIRQVRTDAIARPTTNLNNSDITRTSRSTWTNSIFWTNYTHFNTSLGNCALQAWLACENRARTNRPYLCRRAR